MSAITGICDLRARAGSASASSCDGTATRTIWQPAAVSAAICCSVALTSAVSVVVIDCTDTGASPPTSTEPTRICRDLRRGASVGGGRAGMPSDTAVTELPSSVDCPVGTLLERVGYRVDDVGEDGQQQHEEEHRSRLQRLPAGPGHAHDADRTVRVALLPLERAEQLRDLRR